MEWRSPELFAQVLHFSLLRLLLLLLLALQQRVEQRRLLALAVARRRWASPLEGRAAGHVAAFLNEAHCHNHVYNTTVVTLKSLRNEYGQ